MTDSEEGEVSKVHMTSIFNTYYSRNVDRLNASFEPTAAESAPQSDTRGGAPGVDRGSTSANRAQFAEVLADLEHRDHGTEGKEPISEHTPGSASGGTTERVRAQVLPSPPQLTNIAQTTPALMLGPVLVDPTVTPSLIDHGTDIRAREQAPAAMPARVALNTKPIEEGIHGVKLAVPGTPPSTSTGPPSMPRVAEIRREAEYEQRGIPPMAPTLAAITRRPTPTGLPAGELARANHRPAAVPASYRPVAPDGRIREIVTTAGRYYGIDPNLSLAVAQVESSFDTDAVSTDGHESKGLFQLLDSTGQQMHRDTGLDEEYDPFDPAQNAYLGVAYLRRLHDIFSEETALTSQMKTVPASSADQVEKLAVAAFNAGEGSVARAQSRARALGKDPSDYDAIEPYLPASTQRYVQRVTSIRSALASRLEADEDAKA